MARAAVADVHPLRRLWRLRELRREAPRVNALLRVLGPQTVIAAVGIYVVIEAAVILLGVMGCIGVIGFVVLAALREEKDRSLFPWGPRARVERARAAADVIEQQTRQEVAEIKRLSLEPHRQRAIEDIREGRIPDQNGLPAEGEELRKEAFGRG